MESRQRPQAPNNGRVASRPAADLRSTVRADPEGQDWWFAGCAWHPSDDGCVVIHPDDLPRCRATDLQRLLRRLFDAGAFDNPVLVTEADENHMHEDGGPVAG